MIPRVDDLKRALEVANRFCRFSHAEEKRVYRVNRKTRIGYSGGRKNQRIYREFLEYNYRSSDPIKNALFKFLRFEFLFGRFVRFGYLNIPVSSILASNYPIVFLGDRSIKLFSWNQCHVVSVFFSETWVSRNATNVNENHIALKGTPQYTSIEGLSCSKEAFFPGVPLSRCIRSDLELLKSRAMGFVRDLVSSSYAAVSLESAIEMYAYEDAKYCSEIINFGQFFVEWSECLQLDLQVEVSLTHGDLQLGNVLVGEGFIPEIRVIDWESCRMRWCEFDLITLSTGSRYFEVDELFKVRSSPIFRKIPEFETWLLYELFYRVFEVKTLPLPSAMNFLIQRSSS